MKKSDVKGTRGRAWLQWQDYFKMVLKEIDWEGGDRTNMPQHSD